MNLEQFIKANKIDEEEGIKVIIVDESSRYEKLFADYYLFDKNCASAQIFQSQRVGTKAIIITHNPFACRVADKIYKFFTHKEHYLYNGEIKKDSVEFSRIKHGNVLDAYGTDLF